MNVKEIIDDITKGVRDAESKINIYNMSDFVDEGREKNIISDLENVNHKSDLLIKRKEDLENPDVQFSYVVMPMTKEENSQLKYQMELFKYQVDRFGKIAIEHGSSLVSMDSLNEGLVQSDEPVLETPSIEENPSESFNPSTLDESMELPIFEPITEMEQKTEVTEENVMEMYQNDIPVEMGNTENVLEQNGEEKVISFNKVKVLRDMNKAV